MELARQAPPMSPDIIVTYINFMQIQNRNYIIGNMVIEMQISNYIIGGMFIYVLIVFY
jgi:hypothetical protein